MLVFIVKCIFTINPCQQQVYISPVFSHSLITYCSLSMQGSFPGLSHENDKICRLVNDRYNSVHLNNNEYRYRVVQVLNCNKYLGIMFDEMHEWFSALGVYKVYV